MYLEILRKWLILSIPRMFARPHVCRKYFTRTNPKATAITCSIVRIKLTSRCLNLKNPLRCKAVDVDHLCIITKMSTLMDRGVCCTEWGGRNNLNYTSSDFTYLQKFIHSKEASLYDCLLSLQDTITTVGNLEYWVISVIEVIRS